MIAFGAQGVLRILSEYLPSVDTSQSLQFLKGHSEKLDQFHRHVVLSAAWKENTFCVFSLVDTSGRKSLGLCLTNPFEKNLSLFTCPKTDPVVQEAFVKLFNTKPEFLKSAIVRLPFQNKVLAVVGERDFLEKEILKEKVLSLSNFLFAQRITDEIYSKLHSWNGSKVKFAEMHLLDDFAACVLRIPDNVDADHVSLLSEIARVYRPKYGDPYQGNMVRFKDLPILTIFSVDYDSLLTTMDLDKRCQEFCEKILRAYQCVIRT